MEAARAVTAKRVRALESELQALHAAADGDGSVVVGDDARESELLVRPPARNMDPFACLYKVMCVYDVLHESRRIRDGRVVRSMVIVGPHWVGVVVTLAILLVATGAFLQQQCTTLPWYYTLATLAFFALTAYYLFETACRDPGIVLPSWYRDGKLDDECEVVDEDEGDSVGDSVGGDLEKGRKVSSSSHKSAGNHQQLLEDDDQLSLRSSASTLIAAPSAVPTSTRFSLTSGLSARFCDLCGAHQEPFTEHCDDCDVCVAEYDHHCPWMGKCIGKQNMRAFKLFNLSWVLFAVFVVSVAVQNVDWGDVAVQRLQRAANGSWVPASRGGDAAVRAACRITDNSASCYTASWFLIWDQVRYWLLFQAPVVAAAVVYEWLEVATLPRVERLRGLFDSPLTRAANHLLQLVASVYVCIAWVVRGGSLSVNLSLWSIESFLLIAAAVGYALRWLAAKQKVVFTLQLHSLVDLLSIVSHFAINFQTAAVGGQLRRSWLDFGFLRAYVAYVVVDQLFARARRRQPSFVAQVLRVGVKAGSLVFVAACVLFSLERLGDIPYTDSFLLHVYKCRSSSADDSRAVVLSPRPGGSAAYPDCVETWSVFASVYFMFVTVSTVGYGDFSPKTVLGQLTVCGVIGFGIYTFARESAAFVSLYGDERGGRVTYHCSRNSAHVVVTGNPSAAQLKDFIREFFHPDHEATFRGGDSDDDDDNGDNGTVDTVDNGDNDSGDADDTNELVLEEGRGQPTLAAKWRRRRGATRVRETHIVVLMRFDADASFQRDVTDFVRDHPRYHRRVFLLYGSPLRRSDLAHAKLREAVAVFFLPNKFANDGNQEDAATVLRVLAVSQHVAPHTQLFAMLVNSANRTLLEATGMGSENLVCADELRLGLMGLSCRCPGLSTLVSNLITSRSGDVPFGAADGAAPSWVAEYVAGAANEIYSCNLAPHFVGLTFTAAAQRIHAASGGLVLLIAVEADGDIAFNPGRWFHVARGCRAYLIAESVGALAPFASPSSFVGAPATLALARGRANLVARARRAQHNVERRVPSHVREYILRCGSSGIGRFKAPTAPPAALLAQGGHIVVCSNVASEGGGQRSVSRLVNFLRPLRAPHIERVVPVVLVDAERFDGVSWLELSAFGDVYQVQGSPQRHSVLVAAGVYSASAIVVLAQGTEAGYDDSKAIFNAILINAALQHSRIFTIIELRDVHNNRFLDPVASFGALSSGDDSVASEYEAPTASLYQRRGGRFSAASSGPRGSRAARKSSSVRHVTWLHVQTARCRAVLADVGAFFLGNLRSAAHRVNALGHARAAPALGAFVLDDDDDDTFFQERFMRGALFPSYVADDLLIQSFFNPSLNTFMRKILDGKSCFMLYDIPKQWRHQALTYGELFAHMTAGIAHALPIGLLRAAGGANGAPCPYVYTCPAASAVVYPEDKVFVIIDVQALHRVANKLQRRFRNRRKAVKDPVTFADTVGAAARRAAECPPVSSRKL